MTEEEDLLCPITLCKLPADPLDVAYVWSDQNAIYTYNSQSTTNYGCGHKCTLRVLLRYINNTNTNNRGTTVLPLCPVCCESPILAICDGVVMVVNSSNTNTADNYSIGCKSFHFRYGRQAYRLAVAHHAVNQQILSFLSFLPKISSTKSRKGATVQQRICQVLQLDERSLKILRKGKVIHPDRNLSEEEISDILLELSLQDGNKTSMIVMGTSVGTSLAQTPKRAAALSFIRAFSTRILDVLFTKVTRLSNFFYSNALSPAILFFTAIFRPRQLPGEHFRQD